MTLLQLHSVAIRTRLLQRIFCPVLLFRYTTNNSNLFINIGGSSHVRLLCKNYNGSSSKVIRLQCGNFTKCGFHTGSNWGTVLTNKRNDGPEVPQACSKCSHSYVREMVYSTAKIELIKIVSCPKCGALQRIDETRLPNYFEIFGHDKNYGVDIQAISNESKQLQKKFHPDLYSQKGSDQQDLSQTYSSLINKALSTLSNPISRGRYLLSLSSGLSPTANPDDNNNLERTITKDPDFLEEMMELNERLEEISSEKDWKDFRNQNVETMKEIHVKLQNAFDKEELKEAHGLLGRLQYFETLQSKLKEVQSKIGIVE